MKERTVVVASAAGLHARPAATFTSAAAGTGVKIAKGDGAPVDASSILSVMALDVAHGDTVTISVNAEDETALDALAQILGTDQDRQE